MTDQPSKPTVAIGVCTYRRPAGLARLLEGLDGQVFRSGPEPIVSLVIVDNDAERSAEAVVAAYARHGRFPARYHHEPRPGLSSARNALLDTTPEDADYLATIDDDEWPEPQWLDEHLRVARSSGAALVGGVLSPVFEREPPIWMREGRFFEIGPFVDGEPAIFIGAGNALMDLERIDGRFDPRFNTTGGEDEAFFDRLMKKGLLAVNAAEARVHETIPPERTRLRWLLRRHFRMGSTRAMIERDGAATLKPAATRAAKSAARILRGSLMLAPALFRGKAACARALLDIAFGAGGFAGLIDAAPRDYGKT